VQVAVALLEGLRSSNIEWKAVFPHNVLSLLPEWARSAPEVASLRKASKLGILLLSIRLKRLEAEYRPDVVYTVFGPPYFRARGRHVCGFALPSMLYRWSADDDEQGRALRWCANTWRGLMLSRMDALIVETETVRDRLKSVLGHRTPPISVIPNGVNPRLTRIGADIGRKSPNIVVPSAYYKHKNLEILPKVASELRRECGVVAQFTLTLDTSSLEWRRIAAAAERLGVRSAFQSVGHVEVGQLGTLYANADAVLLPSRRECSSAVFPEAFFFELPLIVSDIDFARDLCGDAALYADPNDATAIAQMLYKALTDNAVRSDLASKGRKRLASKYATPSDRFRMQIEVIRSLT
jgi:glycosyltransferase involved in cell wall biosynthesis